MPCLYTILYSAQWVWTWSETKILASQLVLLKSTSSDYSRQLGSQLLHKINFMLSDVEQVSKISKYTVKTFILFFFWLENWFPFIFYLCFMLYIRVLKICLKYFKHYIQLSQMSKMSNSRSRAQYITLKRIPLIQRPWIGVGDRNSYFYHQMLFLGVIFFSTVSKMSNYMVKT